MIQVTKTGGIKCVNVLEIWWWDCVSAQNEAMWSLNPATYWKMAFTDPSFWQDYGWNSGSESCLQSHTGSKEPGSSDANHWNWRAAVIYVYCGKDGHKRVGMSYAGPEEWTWNDPSQTWVK